MEVKKANGVEETRPSESSHGTHTTTEDQSDYDLDEPNLRCWTIPPILCKLEGEIITRFYKTVNKIKDSILEWERAGTKNDLYVLEPVLIAVDVEASVLQDLPSLVGEYHVKCCVRDYKLFITNLSNGTSHGIGVSELHTQTGLWPSKSRFTTTTDTTLSSNNEANGSSPDLVIGIKPRNRGPGSGSGRLIIVELEVSNRSIGGMRKDFLAYFADESVYAVVGIKMFTTDHQARRYPTQRALAVQWTRVPGIGVITESIRDFGLVSISAVARALFAEHIPAGSLPQVDPQRWVANRHIPVPIAVLPLPGYREGDSENLAAAVQFISSFEPEVALNHLYGGVMPTLRFDGATLQGFLHNLPPGLNISDFVLDLGRLMHCIQEVAPHSA